MLVGIQLTQLMSKYVKVTLSMLKWFLSTLMNNKLHILSYLMCSLQRMIQRL
ncbi:Uncharacterised protein [Acinetobacter baumannii]|nr:Uncharacterised protein [Acinetobacter baumannii]